MITCTPSNTRAVSLLLLAASCIFFSCEHDKEECVAGTGGKVSVAFLPEHHGEPIMNLENYSDSLMIRFNTSEFPGDDPLLYDIVKTGQTGTFEVSVEDLKCGKYFVFMSGWDVSIAERVKGGIPVNITRTEGNLRIVIPVTED